MRFSRYATLLLLCNSGIGLAQQRGVPVKIAVGDSHGLWLKADGTVWIWGGNRNGQLGIPGDLADTPARVPGLAIVRDIAAGSGFSAAVTADGNVWTWGENGDGELGDGTTKSSATPKRIASLTGVTAVAASSAHILALRSDGAVWQWGANSVGPQSSTPKRVENFGGVVAMAAADRHSVALKADGTVWVWGDHGAGDLGNGNYNLTSAPLQIRGLTDIKAIAAAYQLTIALKRDGTVWTVGYGAAGQLGNGTEANSSLKPVMVAGLTGVTAVAGGYMHALALKSDGTVWSWGYNHESQLGNPRVNAEQSSKPVRSGTISGVVAIAAAGSHSAAISGPGVVWVWGQNDGGSLGVDEETLRRSDVPMRVGQSVPGECSALFSCSTDSGKVIRICGEQDPSNVSQWTDIQYRFGPQNGPPELMYPEDASNGKKSLFFSHEEKKGDYVVTIRFSNGAYTYRVYSGSHSGAGVEVVDAKGKAVSHVACNERPEMYADYLRENLTCDPQNPHGAAACKERPFVAK